MPTSGIQPKVVRPGIVRALGCPHTSPATRSIRAPFRGAASVAISHYLINNASYPRFRFGVKLKPRGRDGEMEGSRELQIDQLPAKVWAVQRTMAAKSHC